MRHITLILILIMFLTGCSDFDAEWKDETFEGRIFERLVVAGISHELDRRKTYEQVGTEELESYGIRALRGLEVFPQAVTEMENNSDTLTSLIEDHRIDAALVIKVLHEDDHSDLMLNDRKIFLPFRGRWGRSRNLHHGTYYNRPEKYYMIARLYDLHEKHVENDETEVWRAVSVIMNPAAKIEKKKEFIRMAISHLVDQKLVLVSEDY